MTIILNKIFSKPLFNSYLEKNENSEEIKISIFYDSLCGDSRFFFKNSLRKLYNTIDQLKINLLIDLYPGALEKSDNSFLNQNNDYTDFTCKHGQSECYANAVHSCALFYLEKNLAFNFIFCYFDNIREYGLDINQTSEFCLNQISSHKVYSNLINCASGLTGKQQMDNIIKLKENINGKILYSPSILINNLLDYTKEDEIESDILAYLCKNLTIKKLIESDICKTYKENGNNFYFDRIKLFSRLKMKRK